MMAPTSLVLYAVSNTTFAKFIVFISMEYFNVSFASMFPIKLYIY